MSDTWSQVSCLSVMGMTVVFSVLMLVAGLVTLVRRFGGISEPRDHIATAVRSSRDRVLDDLTVVLITAAAITLLKGRGRIRRIRKVRHSEPRSSPWILQGRATLIGSHQIQKNGRG